MIQHSNYRTADVNYQYLIDKLAKSVKLKVLIVFLLIFNTISLYVSKGLLVGLRLLGGVESRKWAI